MILGERTESGVTVLVIGGRLDGLTSLDLETELVSRIDAGEDALALDARELTYISSTGLRVFMTVSRKLREAGGCFSVFYTTPNVRSVFRVAGLLELFPEHGSLDDAIAACARA